MGWCAWWAQLIGPVYVATGKPETKQLQPCNPMQQDDTSEPCCTFTMATLTPAWQNYQPHPQP